MNVKIKELAEKLASLENELAATTVQDEVEFEAYRKACASQREANRAGFESLLKARGLPLSCNIVRFCQNEELYRFEIGSGGSGLRMDIDNRAALKSYSISGLSGHCDGTEPTDFTSTADYYKAVSTMLELLSDDVGRNEIAEYIGRTDFTQPDFEYKNHSHVVEEIEAVKKELAVAKRGIRGGRIMKTAEVEEAIA